MSKSLRELSATNEIAASETRPDIAERASRLAVALADFETRKRRNPFILEGGYPAWEIFPTTTRDGMSRLAALFMVFFALSASTGIVASPPGLELRDPKYLARFLEMKLTEEQENSEG